MVHLKLFISVCVKTGWDIKHNKHQGRRVVAEWHTHVGVAKDGEYREDEEGMEEV